MIQAVLVPYRHRVRASPGSGQDRTGVRRLSLPLLAAGLLALAASLLLAHRAAGTARAADTWEVQVGAMLPPGMAMPAGGTMDHAMMGPSGQIVAQAFGPDPLMIHVGDSVTFKWAVPDVPHTVTFNSGQPPLPDILPGPGQGELTLGPAFAPAGLPKPDATSATYDGTARLSSGQQTGGATFTVTFTK